MATVLLMAAGLVGCGDGEDPPRSAPVVQAPSDTTDDGPPLSLSIERDRLFGAARQFLLTFRSTGGAEVEVASVQLRSELFSPAGPSTRRVMVRRSGDPVSIPLAYGPASCGDAPSPELSVRMEVDGEPADVPVGKAAASIVREHASECSGNEVRRQVDLRFGPDWRMVDARAWRGRSRSTDAPRPTWCSRRWRPRWSSRSRSSPLPASDDVDLVVTAARCDAHALTESKKTFTFFLTFAKGGGEPIRIELPVDAGPTHDALEEPSRLAFRMAPTEPPVAPAVCWTGSTTSATG
ncbi:MAG: hypothetical protein WKF43_17530 [Acidimicrobiales bacterium]